MFVEWKIFGCLSTQTSCLLSDIFLLCVSFFFVWLKFWYEKREKVPFQITRCEFLWIWILVIKMRNSWKLFFFILVACGFCGNSPYIHRCACTLLVMMRIAANISITIIILSIWKKKKKNIYMQTLYDKTWAHIESTITLFDLG